MMMMDKTIETAITGRLAENLRRIENLPLAVTFYAQGDVGKIAKPACVVRAEVEQLEHPKLSKVTLEVVIMMQLDDSEVEKASETMRLIWSELGCAMEEVCDYFSVEKLFWVRKVRPLGVRSEIEGDRSRQWTLPVEVWVEEFAG
jgi:hypothetical protein